MPDSCPGRSGRLRPGLDAWDFLAGLTHGCMGEQRAKRVTSPKCGSEMKVIPSLKQKELRMETRIPEIPLSIRGDVKLLQGVFENLFSNALAYTPLEGLIEVTILEGSELNDPSLFEIRFSNTLPEEGIFPKDPEKLFASFIEERIADREKGWASGCHLFVQSWNSMEALSALW